MTGIDSSSRESSIVTLDDKRVSCCVVRECKDITSFGKSDDPEIHCSFVDVILYHSIVRVVNVYHTVRRWRWCICWHILKTNLLRKSLIIQDIICRPWKVSCLQNLWLIRVFRFTSSGVMNLVWRMLTSHNSCRRWKTGRKIISVLELWGIGVSTVDQVVRM